MIQNSCAQSDKGSTVLFIWHASCTKKNLRLLSDLIRSRCIQRNKTIYILCIHNIDSHWKTRSAQRQISHSAATESYHNSVLLPCINAKLTLNVKFKPCLLTYEAITLASLTTQLRCGFVQTTIRPLSVVRLSSAETSEFSRVSILSDPSFLVIEHRNKYQVGRSANNRCRCR